MWPFTISNSTCAHKLRLGLLTRFDHAKLYGLTPVDVVMDDYLLGYITSELLTNIEYHCKRRTPGPTLEVIAHLFVPILGKDRATEALERIERELRLNQSDSELGVGFRIGDMVSRISFGEKTFEDNSYVEDARLQAPIIAKERESLGKLSNDMCTFLYLDRINFDKHITDNYSTPEILKLKGS